MSDEERDDGNVNDLPSAGDLLRWAEKTQRTIEFMLQQQAEAQARSEADRERLREMQEENEARWARADERWARIEQMWERTEGSVRSLHAIAQIHEGEITTLAETQAEVGGRVNALVNTVERLISERRNGGRGEEKTE
jgi:transcriptional regulator with XRE-family HTH domain